MSIIEVGRAGFRCWTTIALTVIVGTVLAETGLAQSAPRFVSPTPLTSPDVVVGPTNNSFGPPPMAIGPAPYPTGYGFPMGYVQPFGPPVAFPPMAYPNSPYWVERPTRFDAIVPSNYSYSPPAYFPPQPVNSATVWSQRMQRQTLAIPAPIGNLRVAVSESFLNRLIARNEQKPGDVRDVILGAEVTGRQTTETNLHLDLLPSTDKMRGVFVLNGTTESQTTGVTPQAMVDVASRQRFVAMKDVFFDGMNFTTRHAIVNVQAKNQTLGATTPFSGGLFGRIADRIAYREAERRQPQAEAETRDHVAERVYPEFDTEIDKKLANANDQLEGMIRRRLREMNLMPTAQHVASTDTSLSYSGQFGAESPTASPLPLVNQFSRDDGVCVMLHESFLNALVARTGLKGLKTTDRQIKKFFAPYEVPPTAGELAKAQPSTPVPGMANIVTDIEFDDNEPLTLRIDNDRVFVTMHAMFKPAGQEVVPALAVTIEYKAEVRGDKILITPGQVQVALQKNDDGNSTAGLALKLITQAVEASVSKLAFDRALPVDLWSFGGLVPRVMGIRSQDGWASVSID